MQKKSPVLLGIIGLSDSGKTTLILKLLPALRRRGYRIAAAKHCPRGFDLDVRGKDSWKFTRAGAAGIYLDSPRHSACICSRPRPKNLKNELSALFSGFDLVLLEGYAGARGIKKIQILCRKTGGKMKTAPDIIAYVSDRKLPAAKPVFLPDDVRGIINFISRRINK